jgi:bifunctional ADP-heptose synthase (sugar kinase/adenylyltransferase)
MTTEESMADQEIPVRNVRSQEEEERKGDYENVVNSLVGLGTNVARLGKALVGLGFSLAPRETCAHLRSGLAESFNAATTLPREVAESKRRAAEKETSEPGTPASHAPHDEMSSAGNEV